MVSPSDDHPSRRRVLRASGAALASGLTTAIAGCSGLPPLGSQIRYGTVDVPAPDAPAYREWLPAPSAFRGVADDSDDYAVLTYVPPADDTPAWTRSSISRGLLTYESDYVGVHVDDVDVGFRIDVPGSESGNVAALLGDVDPDAVPTAVADTSYEFQGSGDGYDVYTRQDLERSVAVLPEGLVFSSGPSAGERIRTVVDAGRGDVPRYHERDDNFESLTASAGQRRWAWLWPGGVDGTNVGIREDTVGWGTSFDHGEDDAYVIETWLFPPEYDLTASKVRQSLREEHVTGGPGAMDASAVDVTVEGRLATVAMYMDPDVVQEKLDRETQPTPHTTWRATHEPEADRLTFHHEAGDPVPTESIHVRGGGLDVRAPATGDVGDRIGPGEELTVSTADTDPGSSVQLIYDPPSGNTSSALFTYDLP